MPLIRVVYSIGRCDFDYVTRELLDTLIRQDIITHFYRPSEGRWINIRLDPVRGRGGGYKGPERRGKDNRAKPIGKNRPLNSEARRSDWLDGLWQDVESHDALG
jgi:hypothetical protein